jgi:hypothetical protein
LQSGLIKQQFSLEVGGGAGAEAVYVEEGAAVVGGSGGEGFFLLVCKVGGHPFDGGDGAIGHFPGGSTLFAELVAYIPNVIAAVIVLVLGILIGEFVKDLVLASAGGLPGGPTLGRSAKAAVILLAVFMALEQLNIAQDIVLVFFVAVVGAGALAAGIAFGLGGREIAAEVSRQWYDRMRHADDAVKERHQHASAAHNALISHTPPTPATPSAPPTPPAGPTDIGNPPPNDVRD